MNSMTEVDFVLSIKTEKIDACPRVDFNLTHIAIKAYNMSNVV